jgi:6-phosphogluconolactonase
MIYLYHPNELLWANDITNKILLISEDKRKQNQDFNIILQGGKTPLSIYYSLINKNIHWDHWRFWIGDERMNINNFTDFNYLDICKIFSNVIINFKEKFELINPFDNFYENCEIYNKKLSTLTHIDVALIGLGNDGHVASLFPPHYNINDNCILISNSPKSPTHRITLTSDFFSKSDYVFFNFSILKVGVNYLDYLYNSYYPAYHIKGKKETFINSY